jgi:glycosyltransferase involved in cell wall biosynthesis
VSAARSHGARVLFFTWENVDPPRNPLYAYCDRSCIAHADAVIAGNEEGRSILLRKGCTAPVSVIPQYGVTIGDFIPRKSVHPEGIFQIAYVGRIIPEKGIETLLAAMPGVENALLHIAGTGETRYVERLRQLAVDYGLVDKVVFHGHLSREAVPEFLHRMHILVLPSLTTPVWKEQFGRVLIEAMAARVAVVGSDSGEIKQVLGGGAGLVFREGDARDLREKLSSLIAEPGRFASLVENGYAKAAACYTNDAIADAIHGIYTSLLGRVAKAR